MNRARLSCNPGLALSVMVVAALALGGCGRKGGLQLPPTPQAQAAPAAVAVEDEGVIGPVPNPVYEATPDEPPVAAAKGRKKTFILDPLLNSN